MEFRVLKNLVVEAHFYRLAGGYRIIKNSLLNRKLCVSLTLRTQSKFGFVWFGLIIFFIKHTNCWYQVWLDFVVNQVDWVGICDR